LDAVVIVMERRADLATHCDLETSEAPLKLNA
jgi:hypothetical protein